ncbi:MAG TPA: vWA domain-containing protein [Balneolaceae bacterium]
MDFIFQGFQSTLPVWLYLLIFAACSFFAWWSYSSITGIRKLYRYLLIGLRSSVFFILLALLLNPFFKKETSYFTEPNILVMLDNSASTAIEKRNYQGVKSYQKVLEELNFRDSSTVNFDFFSIGGEPKSISIDELTFNADQTNLSQTVELIKTNSGRAKAAIIISDGIYTEGENPVFEASGIDIPVFTIGLGDTTSQKDVLVESITTNPNGYLNSRHAVEVTVSSKGFRGESFPLQLQKGDEIIMTKTVTPKILNSTQTITFELPLEEEGLQQFKTVIPELLDEWTTKNNVQHFAVNVRDARQQVLSIAFEIHPDVGFIRSLLLHDRRIHLTSRTWLNGNRFIEGTLAFNPDTVDLAIIHGYPSSGLPADVQKAITELAKNVPLIVAATPKFNPRNFESEVSSLPVNASSFWQYSPVSLQAEADTHPILELPTANFEQMPRIFAPIQNLSLAPGAEAIFSSVFQGQPASKPVLAVQQIGNKRAAIFTGYGWFQLGQSPDKQLREFVTRLWLNAVSWTATDPDDQKLEVQPAQTSFSETEPVVVNAYLKNERGEVESQANISISVSSDSMDTKFYSMENLGAGEYQLNLGTLPEGLYSFKAVAKKENRALGTQSGEFAVASSNAEFVNTERNAQLLRQLAQRTGGFYLPFDSLSGFWNQLNEQSILDQTKEIETTFWYPYQHLFWFILVVVLLSVEWIFRKYLSLP